MVYNLAYTAVITPTLCINDKEAEIAYDKQANGQKVNAVDRCVTGERFVATASRVVTGANEPIPTAEERAEMSTAQRIKNGERVLHIVRSNLNQKAEKREAEVFEKQENGENLNVLDRLGAGENVVQALGKTVTFHGNDHIPTPAEREEMSVLARLKSGESMDHLMKQRAPTIRSKIAKEEGISSDVTISSEVTIDNE